MKVNNKLGNPFLVRVMSLRIVWLLLIVYAIFDVARSWLHTQQFVASAVASEVSLIRTPLAMMAEALLLLAATISMRFGKTWGYVGGAVFSAWVIYRGFEKWLSISAAIELPRLSLAVFSYWISYAQGAWDFFRLALAIIVLVYCVAHLTQSRALPGGA